MANLYNKTYQGLIIKRKQISFKDWVSLYKINLQRLAELVGVSRATLYTVLSGERTASLEVAVRLHALSGYEIDMFSLMKGSDGEIIREELEEILGDLTNISQNRVSKGNSLEHRHIELKKRYDKMMQELQSK